MMKESLRFAAKVVLPVQELTASDRTWEQILGADFGKLVAHVFPWQPSTDQVRFFELALEERDVLFHVGTGGGKTVAVLLWLLAQVSRHQEEPDHWCSLALLPTRSILDDFQSRLVGLAERLHIRAHIFRYSAKTSPSQRRAMRRNCETADLILMTPDMFLKTVVRNYVMGQGKNDDHARWARRLLTANALVLEEVDALDARALLRLRLLLSVLRAKARQLGDRAFQTVVTSATIPNGEEVAAALLENGVALRGQGRRGTIQVWVRPRRTRRNEDALELLLNDALTAPPLEAMRFGVFWENKQGLERLSQRLRLAQRGVRLITGDIEERQDQATLQEFKEGHGRGLCFTSISSRSLDITGLRLLYIVGLPPRVAELFQALGRVARDPADQGFVYHLLDDQDAVQRGLLDHPEQLTQLYEQGPPPIRLPEPSLSDIELAVATALILDITDRATLEAWFGPLTQRAVLRLRVTGCLAYGTRNYVAGPGLDEVAYHHGIRQIAKRFTVMSTEGRLIGYLDPLHVAQQSLPGSLLALGQRLFQVVTVARETVVVEPAPGKLEECYSVNKLVGELYLSVKARRQLGPVTVALVEVQRLWTPVKWELRRVTTDEPLCGASIPPDKMVRVAERADGLLFEAAEFDYPCESLELIAAALAATGFDTPRVAVETVRVSGRVLLAERPGGCGLISPVFEQLPARVQQTCCRLRHLPVEERVGFLLPALAHGDGITSEGIGQAMQWMERMTDGGKNRS